MTDEGAPQDETAAAATTVSASVTTGRTSATAATDGGTMSITKAGSVAVLKRRKIPLVELSLTNVTYAPLLTKGRSSAKRDRHRKIILHNITTKISPHKLVAWIGPSGSGKTSLLSVAAGLTNATDSYSNHDSNQNSNSVQTNNNNNDNLSASITVNGEEGTIPKKLIGVVWQDDLLLSNLTVQETIYFAARLKTPTSVSDQDVHTIVHEVMTDLGLLHIADSLIGCSTGPTGDTAAASGSTTRGISGGERKRVAVASELVGRPAVLLLDEPTSGLDATTAQALVQTLKDLTTVGGHAIAMVIHQPRTTIFNMIDDLLLLSKGRVVYNGPASKARMHLEHCDTVEPLPPETGIADWMMDTISNDETRPGGPKLPQHWIDADKSAFLQHATSTTNTNAPDTDSPDFVSKLHRSPSLRELKQIPSFETSSWVQFKLLLARTVKQQRGERLTRVAAILTFSYAFFTSLFWWQIPNDTNGVYQRNSLFFFIMIAQSNQVVIGSVQTFSRERALLYREQRAKKMYRVGPFFIAKTLSDMSNNVLLPTLYGMVVYWTAGLRPTALNFTLYVLSHYLTLSTAQSMGLFLSVAIPNTQMALLLAPAITLFFTILGGFYIPLSNIHVGIRWATWVSFARYGYSSQIVNEYAGRDVPCITDGGDVAISIGNSDYCPVPGEDVIWSLGINGISSSYWFNIGMICVLQLFFRLAAYGILRKK